MKDEGKLVKVGNEDELFEHISSLIVDSRKHVAKAVNTAMVYTCLLYTSDAADE